MSWFRVRALDECQWLTWFFCRHQSGWNQLCGFACRNILCLCHHLFCSLFKWRTAFVLRHCGTSARTSKHGKRNLGIPTLLRLWNEDWRAHKTGCQGCRMAIGIVECLRVSQSFIIARQLLVPSFSIRCRRCCLRCTELIDLAFVLHHTCSILHFSPPTPWNITCSSKKIEFNTCKIPVTRSCQVASPSGLKNQGIGVGERQRGSDFGTCSKTRPSWLRWVPRKPRIPWSICIAAALPQYQVLKRNVWRWICHGHVSSVAHLELILIYFIILTARPWVCIFAPCLCRSSLTFEGVHAKTLKDLCFATSYNS